MPWSSRDWIWLSVPIEAPPKINNVGSYKVRGYSLLDKELQYISQLTIILSSCPLNKGIILETIPDSIRAY